MQQLGRVADPGSGAVGLDQLDRRGRDSRRLVGPLQRLDLSGGTRCIDRLALAVARSADRADHRVDPVAVAPGVIQPLQDQHPQAFAQNRAVGTLRQTAGPRRLGESAGVLLKHM